MVQCHVPIMYPPRWMYGAGVLCDIGFQIDPAQLAFPPRDAREPTPHRWHLRAHPWVTGQDPHVTRRHACLVFRGSRTNSGMCRGGWAPRPAGVPRATLPQRLLAQPCRWRGLAWPALMALCTPVSLHEWRIVVIQHRENAKMKRKLASRTQHSGTHQD